MKNAEDFKKQVENLQINSWPIHNCSMCDYECGFLFNYEGYDVVYDSGCDCTRRYVKELRDWEEVAEHYNRQKHSEVIKKMNEFWGFTE
jgi:hypothetical protein